MVRTEDWALLKKSARLNEPAAGSRRLQNVRTRDAQQKTWHRSDVEGVEMTSRHAIFWSNRKAVKAGADRTACPLPVYPYDGNTRSFWRRSRAARRRRLNENRRISETRA
jgi:hypothetical protein